MIDTSDMGVGQLRDLVKWLEEALQSELEGGHERDCSSIRWSDRQFILTGEVRRPCDCIRKILDNQREEA